MGGAYEYSVTGGNEIKMFSVGVHFQIESISAVLNWKTRLMEKNERLYMH